MSRRSRLEKNDKSQKSSKRIILTILELFFFIVMIYSGWKIICWIKDNNNSKKVIQDISESITITKAEEEGQEDQYEINFAELKEKNSDTVGYLKLNGIDIEFIVVQSNDNNYYLDHSFDNTYNGAGWIFADFRNRLDGTDKNIVIYGHNRRDGSMFGSLKTALTEEWYSNEENRKILFITEGEKSVYEVFSVYKIPVEDYYITTDFSGNEYNEFLNTIKNRSISDFGIDLNEEDSILTLSTCDNNNQYRVVVHAKKVIDDEIEVNKEENNEQ